jgi:hypothetical protein
LPAPLTVPPLTIKAAPEVKVTLDKAPLDPNKTTPPELTKPLVSVPPAKTFSVPPDEIVAPMSAVADVPPEEVQLKEVPLERVRVEPEETTGAETRNVPPALTERLETAPPESTSSVPPLLTVPPFSVPPLLTYSMPPLLTTTPLSTPPADTVSTPPLRMVVALPLPLERMVSLPPAPITALMARPPEETIALPPLLIVSPLITPPEAATTVPPDTTEPLNNSTSAGSEPPDETF